MARAITKPTKKEANDLKRWLKDDGIETVGPVAYKNGWKVGVKDKDYKKAKELTDMYFSIIRRVK